MNKSCVQRRPAHALVVEVNDTQNTFLTLFYFFTQLFAGCIAMCQRIYLWWSITVR